MILNTLQGNELIPKDVDVRIYFNDERIAMVRSRKGLFVVDLKGLVKPEDVIEVVVWKENYSDKDFHDGKRIRTTVADAQNLQVKIAYTLIQPYRRTAGLPVYINKL